MAKENSQEDGPGVFRAGVQGPIMESVSHKQNSVNSDSGSNVPKEFWENCEIGTVYRFCSLYFWSSVYLISSSVPSVLDWKCCARMVGRPRTRTNTGGFKENGFMSEIPFYSMFICE